MRDRPGIRNDRGVTRAKAPRAATRRARRHISFEDMAARRAERLVNLVICLLSTRQFLTAERIRDAVPGYEPADGDPRTDEAFKRMFERDKAELRDLGVPLETGRNSVFDADDGYRITRRRYELPPIQFDPAEAAAVGLAARLWQSAALGTPARNALIKLRAGGTAVEPASRGVLPHVDASDPSLPVFLDAARHARAVRFDYVKTGSAKPERRDLEPWGVLSYRRRWYVVGHDRDRGDQRSFRLSRVQGEVTPYGKPGAFAPPDNVDLLAAVVGRRPDEDRVARVKVTGDGAAQLRRYASAENDGVLTINFADISWLARMVASAGGCARALEPPDLVEAVQCRLAAVAGSSP